MNDVGKILVLVLIISLLVGSFVGGIYYFDKETYKNNDIVVPVNTFGLLLKSFDKSNNLRQLESNFIIEGLNNDFKYDGKSSSEGFVLVDVPVNSSYRVSYFNDSYYTTITTTTITNDMTGNDVQDANLYHVGSLSLSFNDTLKEGFNVVRLNVTPNGYFRKSGLCLSWSPNIIHSNVMQGIDSCGSGWVNYSKVLDNGTFDYLPLGVFRCNERNVEELYREHICSVVDGSKCHVIDMPLPFRFVGKTSFGTFGSSVDHCYDFSYSFDSSLNKEYYFDFEYKALPVDDNDFVQVIFIDKDRHNFNNEWIDSFEKTIDGLNYVDIGSADQTIMLRSVP